MNELSNFEQIRILSDEYYQQRINKIEYRKARKSILEKIDFELNGTGREVDKKDGDRFIERIMSYFKKTDQEKIF